jgi:hypothetical protein
MKFALVALSEAWLVVSLARADLPNQAGYANTPYLKWAIEWRGACGNPYDVTANVEFTHTDGAKVRVLRYLARGIAWNTLRAGGKQYTGWKHWSTMTSDRAIEAGLAAVPDRSVMSEDRFRRRDNAWREKDMHADDEILKEISRWPRCGVAAIYGRLIDSKDGGSDIWPNKAAINAMIEGLDD